MNNKITDGHKVLIYITMFNIDYNRFTVSQEFQEKITQEALAFFSNDTNKKNLEKVWDTFKLEDLEEGSWEEDQV